MTKRYLTIPVVVAGLGLGATAFAVEPTSNSQELADLRARMEKLESNQSKSVDATVTRVLQDADNRSQLMAMEGFTAGWNGERFMLGSANGDFTFMPYLLIQPRSTSNYTSADDGNSSSGYELARVKIGVDGQIFRDWGYFVRWNDGVSDGPGLEQAYITHPFSDQLMIKTGQFIDPVFHEQLVTSDKQLAADRSLLNEIITGSDETYTQGFTVVFSPSSNTSLELGYTDGTNSGNTDFQDWPVGNSNFGIVGRFEWAAMGSKDSYKDFTAMGSKEDSLVIGAGADWTQAGDTNDVLHTVDVQWKNGSGNLSIYGAFVGQYIQNGSGAGITGVTASTDNDSYNWGFLVQAGYMLDQNWEIFGRYDYTKLDDTIAVGTGGATEDNFNEVTAGVNYYFHGHHAKVTVDINYVPNACPAGVSNLGYLSTDDDQFVLRTQLQLML